MARSFCAAAAALVAAAPLAFASTQLARVTEPAAYQKAGADRWRKAARGDALEPGDKLKTGRGGAVTLVFADGSQIQLGANATFVINQVAPGQTLVDLAVGYLRAFIAKVPSRQFKVRTPTSVCAVRGTEFGIEVNPQGATNVQMFSGVLAVADTHGNETLVRDQQSVNVTDRGLGAVQGGSHQASFDTSGEKARAAAQREVGLEMSKEEVQAAAALEARNAVYQQGKAIIDVSGRRVRIEEYIVRPSPTDFKLVVLNERSDRFDYFYYHGTFNTTLPDDLSVALRQLPGCIGAQCQYYLTGFDTARSNTQDNMLEVSRGGHQVDVNNNGQAADAVTAAFDPATDSFISLDVPNKGGVGNQPFFQTLYDYNTLSFNGVPHNGWVPNTPASSVLLGGAGIQTMQGGATGINTGSVATDLSSLNLAAISPASLTSVKYASLGDCGAPDCTYDEPGVEHSVVWSQNAGGDVWDKFDSYIISDDGKVAGTAAFAGATSGSSYKQTLLNWNFEQIVTASEFGGRKIDLAVEPKIFIQSGLIP